MKICRSPQARNLRDAPIDRVDAFILTLLVDVMALTELLEIAPCRPADLLRRIANLADLGLIELRAPSAELAKAVAVPVPDFDEEAVTLRPPRVENDVCKIPTLRPPKQPHLELDLDGFRDPPTGVRIRQEPLEAPLARVKLSRRGS